MNQIEIKQAKEKALEDLRKIREELLQRDRLGNNKNTTKLLKEDTILKLKDSDKKEKRKKHKDRSSHKKHKKSDKQKPRLSLENKHSDSSCSEEEIISQKRSCSPEVTRDDWMTSSVMLKTFSKNKPLPKKQCTETYEPGKSSRELNPHWKNGGSGLPSFKKPKDDFQNDGYDDYDNNVKYSSKSYKSSSDGWAKKKETNDTVEKYQEEVASVASISEQEMAPEFLSDQQMNELGAKIMKAELLNNNELAEELKNKLKSARLLREQSRGHEKESNKFRSKTDRKSHTDVSGERSRKSAADDEYDLKNKFEGEKSKTTNSVKIAKEHKHFNEDFDDIFGNTKHGESDIDKQREIRNKNRHNRKLNNCDKCFNMDKMKRELVVSVGKHVYVALPWHEGLQVNHCLIIPIDHYTCSTELDEDVWQEISSYRRVLTKLFAKRKQDVLFFETARYLQKRQHMVIHCLPSNDFEMAPFYFKKAIEESEYEWSKNKQLVTLRDKSLRKSIPCGLPYFWVNFGMDFGFAHVIENQENFPLYFAQEIIGGMLTLDMKKWRSPREEHNVKTKVKNLADLLKPYDLEVP